MALAGSYHDNRAVVRDAGEVADMVVKQAEKEGGTDNASCVLLFFSTSASDI